MNSSTLPPSFEGNKWVFMSALFCTMVATLVSVTQIYFNLKEMKAIPDSTWNPINIYRYQLVLAYLIVVFAVAPDAVYLWTYNEVFPYTTQLILTIDRIFDSLFLLPFAVFTWLHIRCGAVMKYQLLRRAIPVDIKPSKGHVMTNILCSLVIMIMSVGVALSK